MEPVTVAVLGLGLLYAYGSGSGSSSKKKKKKNGNPFAALDKATKGASGSGGGGVRDECVVVTAATLAGIFGRMSPAEKAAAVPTLQAGGMTHTAAAMARSETNEAAIKQAIEQDITTLAPAQLQTVAAGIRATSAIPGTQYAADCLETLAGAP